MSGTELGTTELKFGTGKIRLFWDAVNERLDILDDADNVLIRIDPATVTSFPGGVAAFDLDAPGAIGGTTPAAGTFTALTANTSLAVNRPAETTAELSLTNSTGTGTILATGTALAFSPPGQSFGFYLSGTVIHIQRTMRPQTGFTSVDLGTSGTPFRDLFLLGDATIGGSVYGATGGNVTAQSDGDYTIRIDADNNGANFFYLKNGEGTAVVTVNETGDLTITGDVAAVDVAASGDVTAATLTTTGAIAGASVAATAAVTGATVTTTGNVTVGDDLTVTGRVVTETVTTFAAGDASPSVAAGNIFITATSGDALEYTAIDDPVEGQPVLIIPTASPVTTIPHELIENRSADWLSSGGEPLNLIYANSQWWEK